MTPLKKTTHPQEWHKHKGKAGFETTAPLLENTANLHHIAAWVLIHGDSFSRTDSLYSFII